MIRHMVKQLLAKGYELQDEVAVGFPFNAINYNLIILTCRVADLMGTSPVLNLKVQHSMDKIHWRDICSDFHQGQFPQITERGIYTISITKFLKYIRVFWTIDGTDAKVSFCVDAVARRLTGTTGDLPDPLIGFILGMQGSGGYYRNPDGTRLYPGLDLGEEACAGSLNHVNAKFPKLASGYHDIGRLIKPPPPADIEPQVTGKNFRSGWEDYYYSYGKLYCNMVNLRMIDIMQKYIKNLPDPQNQNQNAVIGVQTGMSDGSIELCNGRKPNWSHLPESKNLSGLTSFPPNDIAKNHISTCCRDEALPLFEPQPNDRWSNNIYHFTRTLIHGCTGKGGPAMEYGNTRYIFENEIDTHYGGLGKEDYDNCVEDGWSNEITTITKAKACGNHLIHHFMQAYFSFYQAIKDWNAVQGNPKITGYPSGISDSTLGLMVARWIYEDTSPDGGLEAAMKFSNIFYAEHPVEKLEKASMNYAYPDDNYDSVPWPLPDSFEVGSTETRRWKWDFGIPLEGLESTNTTDSGIDKDFEKGYRLNLKAVCRAQFMDTFFEYIREYNSNGNWYFDGFVVHYYSHWSRLPKVLEYLVHEIGSLRSDFKIIINEFGSRQRLKEQKGYKCDKYLEYETGSRFESGLPLYRYDVPLHSTHAAEVARKYLTLAMEKYENDYKIGAVQWEWFIKGADIQSEKCALVQTCGQNPSLPGKRHLAFDAYAVIMDIFSRFQVESVGTGTGYQQGTFDGLVKIVNFVDDDGNKITAFWGYYDGNGEDEYLRVYEEEVTGTADQIEIKRPIECNKMDLYDAAGKNPISFPNPGEFETVTIDTSPKYAVWGGASMEYDPDAISTENYSKILIGDTTNKKLLKSCFDKNGTKLTECEEFSSGDFTIGEIRGFTWMDGGYLLVSNDRSSPVNNGILKFNGFTGEYIGELILKHPNRVVIQFNEIYGIAYRKEEDVTTSTGDGTAGDPVLYVAAVQDDGGVRIGKIYRFTYDAQVDEWICKNSEIWDLSGDNLIPNQIRFSPPTPLVPGGDKKLLVLVSCTVWHNQKLYSTIIYLNNDSTVESYVSAFSGETFNGFGILQDTFLVIASEKGGTSISYMRTFRIVDENGEIQSPPYSQTVVYEYPDKFTKPRGLRISPYDTIVVGIEYVKSTEEEKRIDEYRLKPLEGGNYAFRRIIVDQGSNALYINDFALTYDREGMDNTWLRVILKLDDTSPPPGAKIDFSVDGENTSPSKIIPVVWREVVHNGTTEDSRSFPITFPEGEFISDFDDNNLGLGLLAEGQSGDTNTVTVKYYHKKPEEGGILLSKATATLTIE